MEIGLSHQPRDLHGVQSSLYQPVSIKQEALMDGVYIEYFDM